MRALLWQEVCQRQELYSCFIREVVIKILVKSSKNAVGCFNVNICRFISLNIKTIRFVIFFI